MCRPDGEFLFALLELCLESEFLLLEFLFEAGIGFAGLGFELAFKFRFAAAQVLLSLD